VRILGTDGATSSSAGFSEDVQSRTPAIAIGLSRVGLTGVEKVVRIRDELYYARLDCYVDLP